MRKRCWAVVLVFTVAFSSIALYALLWPRNPLRKYGVHIEWKDEGATPSYPWIEVWCDFEGRRIECPLSFGGIEHPKLSFEDCDGDGVPDIIFSEKQHRQVVAFKPASNGKSPHFIILENNPQTKY